MNDDLPEGWASIKLKEVTTKVGSGATPRGGSASYPDVGIPLIRSQNVRFEGFTTEGLVFLNPAQAEDLKGATVRADDVLLNITGASIGRVTRAPVEMEGGRVNQHVCIIRPGAQVLPRFLDMYLSSPSMQEMIWSEQYGVTRQALTKEQILKFDLPIAPFAEQRRIVAKTEAVLAKVRSSQDRLDKIPTIIKRFRQAVLATACDGRLTHDLRRSGAGFGREVELGEIAAEIRTGPFGSALHKSDYVASGVPVINPVNLVQGKIVPSAEISINRGTFNRLRDYALRTDDIIIARRGEMGRCALVTSTQSGWLCGTGSAILRLKPEARPAYIALVISSPAARTYLSEASVGTTMENLNQKLFKAMPVFLPSVAEQDEIVRRVQDLHKFADRLEVRHAKAKTHVDKVTQSVLAKAFRGQLVTTEAELARREGREYETAERLLERIQATKGGDGSTGRRLR